MAGGAAGVGSRVFVYELATQLLGESFPWGTVIANISGCFIIGLFAGLSGPDAPLFISPITRQIVMTGFLGGYTTYSSFSLQTITLLSNGQFLYASANVFFTLVLCLLGTWIGLTIASTASDYFSR